MAWQTQNFLARPTLIDQLIRIANITDHDVVLDLGAGHGEITARLARHCRRVVAIEKDPDLARGLELRFAQHANVHVRLDDALATRLPREPFKVVANIPFDISARLIRRLTSATYAPADAYLAVQREAAERVIGRPRATLLGALIRPWFEPSIVYRFRRTDFRPMPRVDVVFLRLQKRGPPLISPTESAFYRSLVTYCFCAPTRHLQATLEPLVGYRRFMHLARDLRLEPAVTPSRVPVAAWLGLSGALAGCPEVRARLSASPRSPRRGAGWRPRAAEAARPWYAPGRRYP
jgi:23S rRNA (adenine-N6)-dimethyltransferase